MLAEAKAPFYEASNEAAFYGPKIDIQMKRVNGKEETAFTIQYDFVMPERFDLTFVNKEGKEERPIVIHRSSIGCLERTIAFLIERYAGAFPVWLSPVQVQVAPVAINFIPVAEKIAEELKTLGVRVFVDDASETVGYKIRKSEKAKVPYTLVIGEKEANSGDLAVRIRGQKEVELMSKDKFIERIVQEIKARS